MCLDNNKIYEINQRVPIFHLRSYHFQFPQSLMKEKRIPEETKSCEAVKKF